MYIFIISVLLVSLISLCFFKKKFWENRYLILLISGGVALVATLTTNYATRGNLGTTMKTVWEHPIQIMNLNDSLIDNCAFTINKELGFNDHLYAGDTLKSEHYSHYLFYYYDDNLRIGFTTTNLKSKDWKYVYIAESDNDTTAYFTKKKLFYKKRQSKWITDFSLPYIKTIEYLYLPPTEYAMIPDSLLRKIPSKFTYKIN